MSVNYRAAWVPDDDPVRPWDEAAALVINWVDAQAEELGSKPILVTNAHIDPPVHGFSWGSDWFSRLSGGTARNRAVMSYVPGIEDFEYALDIARSAAVGVVETVSFRVGGWAAEVGALNLLTGQPTPPHLPAVRELLERLAFYGNNGYGDQFGKKMAPDLVRDLINTGQIEPELIPGALAAHHVSARGQKKIADVVASPRR